MTPKVSVIIPVYNALQETKLCLDSLKKNFKFECGEIIVINDFSNNETTEFLNNFCKENPQFQLYTNEENLGFVKTCNKGMSLSTGDIVVLLNSDTEVPTLFCEKIQKCFKTNPKVGIASPISSHSVSFYITLPPQMTLEQMNDLLQKKHSCEYPIIPMGEGFCFCIKREVIQEIGYLDEVFGKGYHEESDYSCRARTKGWEIVLIDDLYVCHERTASFDASEKDALMKKNSPVFASRWNDFLTEFYKNWENPMPKIYDDLFAAQIEVKPFSVKKEIPPKVSVIIPVHNDAPYLVQCLNSVVNQTLEDIEIICVNDGSTDNSLNILNEYASKDNRFKIINQENSGAAVARNKGIEIATGDYLSILDADDFFEDNMLEYLYYTAKSDQSDVVICGFYIYDNRNRDDVQIEYPHISDSVISPFKPEDLKDELFNITGENAWTKLWKADMVKKNNIRFDDLPSCNDISFTCFGLACAQKISFTNIPLIHYRFFNKNQLTNSSDRPKFILKTLATLYCDLVEKGLYKTYEQAYLLRVKTSMQYEFVNGMGVDRRESLLCIQENLPEEVFEKLFAPKDRPAVSLIVAVYNMEKYLPQCMDSLINQTLKNIEIICVDDGSTDSCLKILQDYSSKDNRIKILTQPNSRQSIARRNAMKIATGEYIQYVDADDYIDLNAIECLYLYSKLYDLDMCFLKGKNFTADSERKLNDKPIQLTWLPEKFVAVFSCQNLKNAIHALNVASCFTFYRHDFLRENHIEWMNEALCYEDTPFFIESLLCAKRISALRENFYHRRVHADATTQNLKTNFPDYCKVVLKAMKIVKKSADETILTNYFHCISKNAFAVYRLGLSLSDRQKFEQTLFDFFTESEKISGIKHNEEIVQWCKMHKSN